MGTSIFFTSQKHILHQTFGVQTKYMPKDGDRTKIIDPYIHSIQWSRRFNGLKLYLPLAVFGWAGYEKVIRHQIELGVAYYLFYPSRFSSKRRSRCQYHR